jgi:hypothetical protein
VKKSPSSLALSLAGSLVRHGSGAQSRKLLSSLWVRSKGAGVPPPPAVLSRASPAVSLRSRRKAGITYRVPYLLGPRGRFSYALRWFRAAVRERPERTLLSRLAAELVDLNQGRGGAWRRRDTLHQTALLNRGFIRFLRR